VAVCTVLCIRRTVAAMSTQRRSFEVVGDLMGTEWTRIEHARVVWAASAFFFSCLLVLGVVWLWRRRMQRVGDGAGPRLPDANPRYIEGFAIYFLILNLSWSGVLPRVASRWPFYAISGALLGIAWLSPGLCLSRTLRRGMALSRGRGVLRECLWGLFACAVFYGLVQLVTVVAPTGPGEHEGGWKLVFSPSLLGSGVQPVLEEVMFRGAFLAAAFALAHAPGNWDQLAFITLNGVLLGILREVRGSLIAPVVFHAAFNTFI